jgi:hydrogenase expression/formation protein HypC
MCLAIPGRVEEVFEIEGLKMGKINFGGIRKSVCLEYAPTASIGCFVLVHVGFAISVIDEEEARRTSEVLTTNDELRELAKIAEEPAK